MRNDSVRGFSKHMSGQRSVTTHFWRDSYVESLDPSERLLFLYLLTSPERSLCGIYELPLRVIASDTGFDRDMILRIFDRFSKDKKAHYIDGWVVMVNTVKHQNLKNSNICIGIQREFDEIPQSLIDMMHERGMTHPCLIDGRFYLTKLNLTKPNVPNRAKVVDTKDLEKRERLFVTFWDAYPKKKGKDVVQRWWMKHTITDGILKEILESIARYKTTDQWKKDKGAYIPYPLTFLNQGRWKDEIESTQATQNFKSYTKK